MSGAIAKRRTRGKDFSRQLGTGKKPWGMLDRGEGQLLVGFTYFFHAPDMRRVKIGSTAMAPRRRLKLIEAPGPAGLIGIGLIGSIRFEVPLQDRFRSLAWKREWFWAEPLLMEFIRDVATPFEDGDLIEEHLMSLDELWAHEDAAAAKIDQWFRERDAGVPESKREIWQPHAAESGSHI